MTDTDELARLEKRIATAINEGDIMLADELREQWVRRYLYEKVTRHA